ncbi:hypothetical protein [Enterococcus sp. 5B3_DIV0040]|uniref:hypothetical protein n=1 Tax=Enterococcus sp. 5B3_DIV0040 TaxID=1834182 RepID=UPI000A3484A0|nr:hypothetical protein [Enterococcus sp. 5B3_DIV0040]OTO03242.1 hypothetical protein A5883_000207 [Enterococcus sp. 5B3_DIV0040]
MNQEEKTAVRINAYVSKQTRDWLKEYMDRRDEKISYGTAIEELVEQARAEQDHHELAEIISDVVTNNILEELKEKLDVIRVRTGYADRQTKVLTEVLNHIVNALEIDRMPEDVVLTTRSKTYVLDEAEKRISEQIAHFKQQATAKKAAKEGRKDEGIEV